MKATIASLIFLLLSLAVSSQTYKYIGIEEGLSNLSSTYKCNFLGADNKQ